MDENQVTSNTSTKLPSQKNQLSRYRVAIALFIFLPFIGFYLGMQYQKSFFSPSSSLEANVETTNSSPIQQGVSTPITENLNPNDFTGCINNGGKDITPDFNAPQKCILNDRIYESACVSNDKYFIIGKDLSGILVKYKSAKDQEYSCEYLAGDSDFQIQNEWAEYVFALEDNFLILDSGTGPPPRGLIIYNLAQRKKVFSDSYSAPIETSDGTVTYWSPVKTKPDETNCPEIEEYTSSGLGAEIEEHVVLTLSTLNKTGLGEYRCSATQ